MAEHRTLKQRMHAGEPVNVAFGSLEMDRAQLEEKLGEDEYDLTFVDAQHNPLDENRLVRFCQMATDVGSPALLRIPHPRQAYLCGRYLDMGPLAIIVPLVEDERTAGDAVEGFYYPPVGRRSWWPSHAYGHGPERERREYADWWNETGILILQLESVDGVMNATELALPGVDMLAFGNADLTFDLEAHPEAPFTSFEEAREHVVELTRGRDVKVAAAPIPVGQL